MAVPAARFESVCAIVNRFDAVAHNYERDHELNMWFVLATDTVDTKQRGACEHIEQDTGLPVFDMPKEREFFVGLHFQVWAPATNEVPAEPVADRYGRARQAAGSGRSGGARHRG